MHFLFSQVFDRIRSAGDSEKIFSKVVCINGDVSDPGLGLSLDDKDKLCSDVTIVFHSAATVKFNETLRTAVTLNTLGTKRVIDLCRSMQNLKVCIRQLPNNNLMSFRVNKNIIYDLSRNMTGVQNPPRKMYFYINLLIFLYP